MQFQEFREGLLREYEIRVKFYSMQSQESLERVKAAQERVICKRWDRKMMKGKYA